MENPLQSLSPGARRLVVAIWGGTFIVILFGLIPGWAAEQSRDLGWPHWQGTPGKVMGVALFLASFGLILYCSRLFSRLGRGTPVPIDPPRELVAAGLYRYTRNPIYVGQVGILLSYFLYSGELGLLLYAAFYALLVQAYVVFVEEPGLRRRFGAPYIDYTREVPRWLGTPARRGEDG